MNFNYHQLKEEDYPQLDKAGRQAKSNSCRTQYIGCIGVKTSMKTLPPRTRSEVAKESINRLCQANNINRNYDMLKNVDRMLDEEPNLLYSGTEVQLYVTSTHLNVVSVETRKIIIQHEMPNVSFASSGDDDTVDFVAYVAKNEQFGRACFVLECVHETAKNVLETIARGFQLRTERILRKNASNVNQDSLVPSDEDVISITRASLKLEPWYHGSYLSREESETRLQRDGDFLVRESMLDPGHFVLSVMHNGEKLHLLFDSMNQVRTKEMVFDDISSLVKYHHNEGSPLVADKRIVFLLNGVRPKS